MNNLLYQRIDDATGAWIEDRRFRSGGMPSSLRNGGDGRVPGKGWRWLQKDRPAPSPYYTVDWSKTARDYVTIDAPKSVAIKAKLSELSEVYRRYRDGGVSVRGVKVATTAEAIQEIREVGDAIRDGDVRAPQKAVTRGGQIVDIDLATAEAMLSAVRAHRSACHTREAVLMAELEVLPDAPAISTHDITTGWPT
jgi:hypothetical protein